MSKDYTPRKIHKLLMGIPSHIILTTKLLKESGFTHSNIEKYRNYGLLVSVGSGVYKKRDDVINWEGIVYGLQNYGSCHYHLGGLSALEVRGVSHFNRRGPNQIIYIYSNDAIVLPKWLRTCNFGVDIKLSNTKFLNADEYIEDLDLGYFSIKSATRERAILEVILGIGKYHTFNEANLLMENLFTLRASVLQRLLELCRSVRVKRIFLFLAKRNNHSWFKDLDMNKIDLGIGNRQVVRDGVYDSEFKITYPKGLFENDKIIF